jgi:THO complex subunit 5
MDPVGDIVTDPKLKALLDISHQARDHALSLLDYVASLPAPHTPDSQILVSKQQKILYAYIAQLRGAIREAQFAARDTKASTAEARQEVDRLHLQLQNLFYEQRHLQNEIAACESYEHPYRQLPLIPVEDFLELHPEHSESDEVALTVARIDHEHAEREALEQQRQRLLKRKQGLSLEMKKRKDDLASLDQQLEAFIDVSVMSVLEGKWAWLLMGDCRLRNRFRRRWRRWYRLSGRVIGGSSQLVDEKDHVWGEVCMHNVRRRVQRIWQCSIRKSIEWELRLSWAYGLGTTAFGRV